MEAQKLCANTDLRVQVAVGGNSKRQMLHKTLREGCHLLVGTPGRLQDLLEDQYSGVKAPNLSALVLDEADRLLDDGFSKDIHNIMDLLPERHTVDRQTLLFSATMPREVMHLVRSTLKPDFHFVQTVKEGDIATHEKIPQHIVVTNGFENQMPALLELAKREMEKASRAHTAGEEVKPFKAIVYYTSTANVVLGSDIFQNLKASDTGKGMYGNHPLYPAQISEMHGQLTQQQRTYVSERFRRAKTAILFSTDVTARGMDFPNVTHVIQIGLPPNAEQYIHRIGRTGRGDKTGDGYIFVDKSELQGARRMLRGLPIVPDKSLESAAVDMTKDAQLPQSIAETLSQVGEATKMVSRRVKEAAYLGSLGKISKGNDGVDILMALNQLSRYGWGFEEPPPISPGLANKLGISRIPGINIGHRGDSGAGGYERRDNFGARDGFGYGGQGGGRGGGGGFGGYGGRQSGGDRYGGGSSFRGGSGGRSPGSFGDRRGRDGGRSGGGGYGGRSSF